MKIKTFRIQCQGGRRTTPPESWVMQSCPVCWSNLDFWTCSYKNRSWSWKRGSAGWGIPRSIRACSVRNVQKQVCLVNGLLIAMFFIWVSREEYSLGSDSLRPHGLGPAMLLCPRDFPVKNTGVDCHFLLQASFPTQGSNPGFLHCRQSLYCLSHQGSPDPFTSCIQLGT